tara:strand:+ start:539 stop:1561 length:1023 start_codon:yes stop_codon:yes gene_type:complete
VGRLNKTDVEINMSKDIYKLKYPWPEDVYIQVGRSGVVITSSPDKKNYQTAFFEAFPMDTFLRGESGHNEIEEKTDKTSEELLSIAEKNAWDKYQGFVSCEKNGGHDYERLRDDGYAQCKKCGIKHSGKLPNIRKCKSCGESPAYYNYSAKKDSYYCLEHFIEKVRAIDFNDEDQFFKDEKDSFFPDFYDEEGRINLEYKNILMIDLIALNHVLNNNFKGNSISEIDKILFFSYYEKAKKDFETGERVIWDVIYNETKSEKEGFEAFSERREQTDKIMEENFLFKDIAFEVAEVVKRMKDIKNNNDSEVNFRNMEEKLEFMELNYRFSKYKERLLESLNK